MNSSWVAHALAQKLLTK